ncbi:MAG: hypothetical protein Q8918_10380 [Bacteroidota bacterium]|nr:hypothetical protein [Bacteroidota bacterium]MDP4212540.1 hypothetical protein [Bacteroidota bacterium]MDP4250502.1 hypothetical protein [Bacteroidota bacterium]
MNRKRFLIKLLIMGICVILLDRAIGGLLRHYYFKIRHGEQGRTTYAIDSCLTDLVILGSSRAAHHYASPIISENLHLTCYNAGKDKQELIYCLAMLRMMYKRYDPRDVILDLNPTAFETRENGLDELSVLLPYYHKHREIRNLVDLRNRFEWLKVYSDLYCYNSLALQIIFNNFSNERDAHETSGYVPLAIRKEIIPDKSEPFPGSSPLDSNNVHFFNDIISLTKEHHTRLYVVVSPVYYTLPADFKTIEMAKSICLREKIVFLDYSRSATFLDNGPAMFRDREHLNDSAAVIFSKMLSDSLKNIQ